YTASSGGTGEAEPVAPFDEDAELQNWSPTPADSPQPVSHQSPPQSSLLNRHDQAVVPIPNNVSANHLEIVDSDIHTESNGPMPSNHVGLEQQLFELNHCDNINNKANNVTTSGYSLSRLRWQGAVDKICSQLNALNPRHLFSSTYCNRSLGRAVVL
uniref:Myosin motor domain-containing protein n=1 Tax=Macrostomum lignano TaxID=282301 RepID=A0A1I8HVE5_9PLAT